MSYRDRPYLYGSGSSGTESKGDGRKHKSGNQWIRWSLPLKKEGLSNTRSFVYGALSGIVEPIAGVLGVLAAGTITGVMPWLLAFAAGAMIYVVVEELIPEASLGEHSHTGTLSVMLGFLVMMVLDVALG